MKRIIGINSATPGIAYAWCSESVDTGKPFILNGASATEFELRNKCELKYAKPIRVRLVPVQEYARLKRLDKKASL